jgi:glutathione synthase/RimK-type ligase-like ATP-grasp enzyme
MLIRACGLRTPRTLVTTDPDSAREFANECEGHVIYKSLSGVRSIVRRLDDRALTRLSLLRHGPAQFQEYVPGDDVRVHTVGERVFATRVLSRSVDYRYAAHEGESVEMEATELPEEVEAACRRLAHRLDLVMSGIDLRETPDGEYYCFEVNPCPGFLYYEKYSRQPISLALAEVLHKGADSVRGEPRPTWE